jgi:hypothetical protein
MNGGQISGNDAGGGGGVSVSTDGTFTMNDGEISDNTCHGNGGGVHVQGIHLNQYTYSPGVFKMSGGEINGNTAEQNGDGVFLGRAAEGIDNSFDTLNLSGKPVISDGIFTEGALADHIRVSNLEPGSRIVIEGSFAANQMRVGAIAAAHDDSSGVLTEAIAQAFVSANGRLIGTASGGNVVWALLGSPVRGDINGDGEICALDLTYLRNYLVGRYPYSPAMDVNGDGVVNIADLVFLRRHIVGIPGYELP